MHLIVLICRYSREKWVKYKTWPRGYKTFFMLNWNEHEILTADKN